MEEEMKEPTITVAGYFGKDKEVTRDEFVAIWKEHAGNLYRLPSDDAGFTWAAKVIDETVELAGSEFDRILEESK
jgi:hypothetical protein